MNYSPKLKRIIEIMKNQMKAEGVAGFIVLHEPGYAEYVCNISPPYSCASFDDVTGKARVKALKKDFTTKEEWEKKVADTSNMLHSIASCAVPILLGIMDLSKVVDDTVGAEHKGDGHSSHSSQNN